MNSARTDQANAVGQPDIESGRQTALTNLAHDATNGSLTLEDYAERAVAVQEAVSSEELNAALRGLPDETADVTPARRSRWLVAVFGGTQQRGRWRLSSRLRVVAVFGGADVDLGTAQLEAPDTVITVVALFGAAKIFAPASVPIQLSGLSLLGGKADKRAEGPLLPGSPLVRVRAFPIMGGVAVRDRPQRRKLLDVIRSGGTRSTGS